MRVRLIVPRRGDGGHRDALWKFCKRYWAKERPAWEIVEGDHPKAEGPFNRSAAINRAAEGRWDVAVILDSDTVVDVEAIDRAIAEAHSTGHLVLPFTNRCMLSRPGTRQILEGRVGAWDRWVTARQTPRDVYQYISGCQVVPRSLWDAAGGFDERFVGWGGEDDAFHAVTIALTGHDARETRYPGNAWHLWHRISPHANTRSAMWRQAKALSDRYIAAAWDREQMLAILAEPRSADQIVVVCLTCANRPTLERAIASAEEQLQGAIGRRLICVDAEEAPGVEFPGWDVEVMGRSQGYVRATRTAQFHAVASGQPWVFWLEDDFTFNEPIDVDHMRSIMEAHPELAQLSLKRQPWYPEELAVDDMLAWRPRGTFTQRDGYIEHRAYWTVNPMIVRREFLAEHEWPSQSGSERRFGQMIFRKPGIFGGILGALDDPPLCHHLGDVRAGHGY
jgi:GT2 family glycosyltransferase